MFEVTHRKKMGIRLKDVYYAKRIRENDPDYDAVYYFFCQESAGNGKRYLTTVVDLSMDEDELIASFRYSERRDIKRIINDINLEIETIIEPDDQQINNFILLYNQFTRMKGFSGPDEHRILTLNRAGRVALLNARYQDELVLQRIFVVDDEKVVIFNGYNTRLEESDSEKLKLLASISKMVDYHSMLYWKKRNKKYYDMGGLFMDPTNPSGEKIDHYKRGFRGDVFKEYEFIYPLTWKGTVFCWLKRQLKLIKRKTHM